MKRSLAVWIAFALCLAVVTAAMGWVTRAVLRVEEAEADARRQAALEVNVGQALWRMDFFLAPILAQESARPSFCYGTFLPIDRVYGQKPGTKGGGQVLVPSPLLAENPPYVLVHFQFQPDGPLTSPRVPSDENYRLSVPKYLSKEAVEGARSQLAVLEELKAQRQLLACLPESAAAPLEGIAVAIPGNPGDNQQRFAQRRRMNEQLQQEGGQAAVEYNLRNQAVAQNTNVLVQQAQSLDPLPPARLPAADVRGVPMTPLWLGERLVLARRVSMGGETFVQGCLLDWPALKAELLDSVQDLLPNADLRHLPQRFREQDVRRLAALPVQLVPGPLPAEPPAGLSPLRLSLVLAWAGMAVAALAVAALLGGVIRLSERRAAFVSAVTHELRTPLTTFHMYTEMLSEGMVADAETRQTYLNTLRREALRLTHLVENVLAYARLERGRRSGQVETLTLGELVDQARPRLLERASQAGMELAVDGSDEARAARVRANPSAVEQILFNLVDNACKYASSAADKRIHLRADSNGRRPELRVCDHGPGVPRAASRRLFRSFTKSAREAAQSAPGIGLGLALSRRLARDMGARLTLESSHPNGACFVLRLRGAA